jgi:SAM-dependent methyltransferase
MTTNYDRIARFYDVDMARNMPFDDVGFYRTLAAAAGGRVLELGCGNGRILLELLAAGVDVIGVDASSGMLHELRRKANGRGLAAPVAQMDIRRLALEPAFRLVLVPYSLVTYMTTDAAVEALLAGAHAVLLPGGRLLVDAFIPRPTSAQPEFTLDYRRPFGEYMLARWKRVRPAGPDRNCIERRYRVEDAAGRTLESIDVEEEIRPFAPDALRQSVRAAGFAPGREWWNYGITHAENGAQFFTLEAERIEPESA